MIETSPLRRAAEQPPCDARCEALCLSAMFAVPERMLAFDLSQLLVFAEHRAIWRSMQRAIHGSTPGFWWRTFMDLKLERPAPAVWELLGVLEWAPHWTVDDSNEGCLVFMLALGQLKRCADARRKIHAAQEEVSRLWRMPDVPYSIEEKRRVLGLLHDISGVGMDIPV